MPRIAIISNELPPYRVPFFRALSRIPDVVLQVLFCSRREPNRQWEIPALDFGHLFLRERFVTRNGRYIHNNPGVVPALYRFSPDVIVTGGFNPTHLYAFAYAMAANIPHVAMTDGTDRSEQGLSRLHRLVRQLVYARTRAFVAASRGGHRLYEQYQVPSTRRFSSCLCIDNNQFAATTPPDKREVDFLFCGRLEAVKNPLFALEVAVATARKLGRKTRILFVGAGSQEEELRQAAAHYEGLVESGFQGFLSHADLPSIYCSAKLFLFPTIWDPWGVVANEACAAGLPVLVSPHAGVAGELVVHGKNGYVTDLDLQAWTDHAVQLLNDREVWQRFSAASIEMVSEFTYANAASGLFAACEAALSSGPPSRRAEAQHLS